MLDSNASLVKQACTMSLEIRSHMPSPLRSCKLTSLIAMEEPYLLASYSVDSVTDADPFAVRVNGLQYQEDSAVNGSASFRAKQRERRPVAVTTVQRNGVHLVDVSTQRCLI